MGKGLGEGVRFIYGVRVVCGVIRYMNIYIYIYIYIYVYVYIQETSFLKVLNHVDVEWI